MKPDTRKKLLAGAILFSLLPIWRPAAGWEGMNLWQFAMTTVFVEHLEHVPVDEAIENAKQAYCQVMGLDYSQSYGEPAVGEIGFIPEAAVVGMTLPVWRSGLHEGITGWEWLWHHVNEDINHIPVTHIPGEDYLASFENTYGQEVQ